MDEVRWRIVMAQHHNITQGSHYEWFNDQRQEGTMILKLVRQGSLPMRRGALHEVVHAGEALHFRHGEDSSYGWPGPVPQELQLSWLALQGAGIARHWQWLDQRTAGHLAAPASPALRRSMDELISLHSHDPHRLDLGSRIYALVEAYAESHQASRQSSLSPLQLAMERLAEQPLAVESIHALAQSAGVSREHLARCFQQRYHQAPAQWLHQRRLDHAAYLLRESNLAAQAVAQLCGFASANVLARALRRHWGLGPRALREQLRRAPQP